MTERRALRALFHSPAGIIGTALLAFAALLAIAGPVLAPYDPTQFHASQRLQGPSAQFWLGTDQFGRDILSRILVGAPATIMFGVTATLLGTAAGTSIGLVSAFLGGKADEAIMRVNDALLAFPGLLKALLIVTVLGPSVRNAMLAVAVATAPSMARIARSVALSVRARDFVAAAIARGEGATFIMTREMLPNVVAPVIVEATIRVAFAIMTGATLSFLGMGAQPPASDWGLMIAEARNYMHRNPWMVVWPGLSIAVVAVGFNMFGDALRDALNPREDRRR
jgi:peptide/nickel transport system permease protein